MSRDDLEEEKSNILSRLFDAFFGRREATEEEVNSDAHRLGTVNRRLRDDD